MTTFIKKDGAQYAVFETTELRIKTADCYDDEQFARECRDVLKAVEKETGRKYYVVNPQTVRS